jgi:hypothetical protein
VHVTAEGEFHLKRMNTLRRHAMMPRCPAPAKSTITHGGKPRIVTDSEDSSFQRRIAAGAIIGADVEMGELTIEQARNARPDGVRIIKDNLFMPRIEPRNFSPQRRMVGVEVALPT